MKTREFNLCNWSGDTAIVSYNVSKRTFEFQGETWSLTAIEHIKCGICVTELHGIGWTGKLANIVFDTNPNKPIMMHEAVIAASRWIANHV